VLSSVLFEGRFTESAPSRTKTRGRRILHLPQETLPSRNLSSRFYEAAREQTHINFAHWLQSTTEPCAEAVSIEPYKILEAPGLEDDYYLNLIDWSGHTNTIAVGLQNTIYHWNSETEATTIIASVPEEDSIASVAWMPGTSNVAVGTKQGRVELFDSTTGESIRTFSGHCGYRTGVLSWNPTNLILSSGARNKTIYHHDHRTQDPVSLSVGHTQEVCGLKWNHQGTKLASGGNDNKVVVWDPRSLTSPSICYESHTAAVKALAWSPHVNGLLASGGGTADRTIKFWNTRLHSPDPIKTITGNSQVCAMVWSPHTNEIISTHGFSEHQVLRWSYPRLQNTAVMMGHHQRVLHLCLSPDGQTVVTGSPDETLRFWKVFEPRKDRNGHAKYRVYDMFHNPFE
jgi:cell division cycle 20-like protein 1 (cofactor of APC complex)